MSNALPNKFPRDESILWSSRTLCLCRLSASGKPVQGSPAFYKLFSLSTDEPLPESLASFIHPEDRFPFMDDLSKVWSQGLVIEHLPVRLSLPNGRIVFVEAFAEPVLKEQEPEGVLLGFFEVSGEETVVSWGSEGFQEYFLEMAGSFAEGIYDMVAVLDTEGNIIHTNLPLRELLGYQHSEIHQKPVAALFEANEERYPKSMQKFTSVIKNGRAMNVSTHWVTSAGSHIPVSMSVSLVRSNTGELTGMMVVGKDQRQNVMSGDLEGKNRELEKAYEELKHLDRMKDDLISLVGHELRGPLSNILGYAEFLKEWNPSRRERKRYCNVIYDESIHLRQLVNDILDLSKLESDSLSFNYVSQSINKVIEKALQPLQEEIENKSLKVETDLDDQIEPVEMDPAWMRQAISRVLDNAVKFSPAGKSISIKTEPVEEGVRISVADRGPGIDPSRAHKVFERFGQIEELKHHSRGAGLGMSIAKMIVEKGHGGRLWFESEGEGKGTTFMLTLPERKLP
ncbi:MAG: ATP-binding protein [bacterium]